MEGGARLAVRLPLPLFPLQLLLLLVFMMAGALSQAAPAAQRRARGLEELRVTLRLLGEGAAAPCDLAVKNLGPHHCLLHPP